MITFFYLEGKSITFEFYWAGQTEVYGKEMEITVKLVSLLDGLVNANFFVSAQTSVGEKGINFSEAVAQLQKQFGLTGLTDSLGQPMNLIRYTRKAQEDTSKAVVKFNYNDGATFMDALQNLVKDNGNNVFFNNIGGPNAVIYTPYSWESYEEIDTIPAGWDLITNPDPAVRYGYFIGPGIIQSFTRTYEWQPPQKSQEITSMMSRKAEERKEARRRESLQKKQERASARNATVPSGVHGSKTTGNVRSENNEDGPRKQDTFTKERSAKLSLSTLMCPAITGIKPLDIIFIPNYSGKYIEDWIVSSVEYQQNDKGVDISIQATRPYGEGQPMNETNSTRFSDIASNLGLTGKGVAGKEDVLRNWVNFAWSERLLRGGSSSPSSASLPSSPEGRAKPDKLQYLKSFSKPLPSANLLETVPFKGFSLSKFAYSTPDELFNNWLRENYDGKEGFTAREYPPSKTPQKQFKTYFFSKNIDQKWVIARYEEFNKKRAEYISEIEGRFESALPAPTVNPTPQTRTESPLTLTAPPTPQTAVTGTTTPGATGAAQPTTTAPGTTTLANTAGATNAAGTGGNVTQPAVPVPQPPVSPALPLDTLNLNDLSRLADQSYRFQPTSAVVPSSDNRGAIIKDPLFAAFLESGAGGLLLNDLTIEGTSAGMVRRGGTFSVKGATENQLRELFASPSFEVFRKDKKTRLF